MSIKKTLAVAMLAAALAAPPAWAQSGAASGQADTRALAAMPSFAPMVEKVGPAVVNISAVKVIKTNQNPRMTDPFGRQDPFFEFFFGPRGGGDRKAQSLGSGFIFDPAGYIVTNNHVVEGAEDITVKLAEGEEIHADIVGRDPKTDLALIKLKKEGVYPYLAMGDSDAVKVGDWVVAIGSPMQMEHSVTAGIISARERRAISGIRGAYDDYLQTDASINPGNSGGPLLNIDGEVIGINTAILTNSGANIGIGFAIPANLAKGVVEQLKGKGRVVRGWMGVLIQQVTPELAESYGLNVPRGALIGDVDPDGPGVAAKLERGDIVLKFDGRDIKDWQDLPLTVANTEVGKKVEIVVFRDKKEVTLKLTVAELKEDPADFEPGAAAKADFGMTLREITPEIASRMNLSRHEGVYIAAVEPGSAAEEARLTVGDVIVEIDDQPVKNMADYRKAVSGRKKDDKLRFLIERGSNTMFYILKVE